MNLTQQDITDLFQQAHMADRTHDHRKELAYAEKMQRIYNRQNGIGKQLNLHYPVGDGVSDTNEKTPTEGYKATSIEDALNKMEELLGYKS